MRNEWRHIAMMLCTGLLLVLTGCADDAADDTGEQRTHTLQLSLGTTSFRLGGEDITRATTLPTGFESYNHATYSQPFMQIQGYMTYEKDGHKYIPCQFNHDKPESNSPDIWLSTVPLYILSGNQGESSSYYFYGYMPKDEVTGKVSLTPYPDASLSSDFANGAVMTLEDLSTVTASDICIVVGLKGYGKGEGNTDVPSDMTGRLGKFDYYPNRDGDKLFLLVDHIYSGLQVNMKLGSVYSNLRSIKVKYVKLTPTPEEGKTDVAETVKAVITLQANNNGSDPLQSVVFHQQRGTNPNTVIIYDGKKDGEKELVTNEYRPFHACLCPAINMKFRLDTTYDVYDLHGNLIRKDCEASNAIGLKYNLERGQMHQINITVEPTYLYVLSDPDLDNPTFRVEN